jgi:hypothetical protein
MVHDHLGNQQGQLVFEDQREDKKRVLVMIYSSIIIK